MKIENLFKKPKIISLIGDVDTGKSMLLYWIIETLKEKHSFNLYTYGLRKELGQVINSIEELEKIRNAIIILDEIESLWDLDNKMKKKQIEATLRLIFHNNNILVLCGTPSNFRKFISAKTSVNIYKKVTFEDFINGSKVKYTIMNYKGVERGTTLLNIDDNEAILFDGDHYTKLKIPYLKQYDSKRGNPEIIQKVKHLVKKK